MTRLLVALFVLIASVAQAQPIHGHPQKAAYASEAERVMLDMQCQWREVPVPLGIIDPGWQHTHIQLWPFLYQDVGDGLIRIPFALVLKNLHGVAIVDLARQELVVKVEWDDIGEVARREIPGDPQGITHWPGHLTLDPRRNVGGHGFTPHGWYSPQFEVNTFFDTGANILQLVRLPFYSVQDASAPEFVGGFPALIGSCYPHTADVTEWGTNYIQAETFLPLLPFSTLWTPIVGSAAYGGNEIGEGHFDVRADFDLHAGNPGRLLQSQRESTFTSADRKARLDPAVLGPGTHPVAFIWSKPTRDDSKEVTALMKFTVTVDPNVPPPPELCQDPSASNLGHPLPCVFPPPPPVCLPPAVVVSGECVILPPPPVLSLLPAGTYEVCKVSVTPPLCSRWIQP